MNETGDTKNQEPGSITRRELGMKVGGILALAGLASAAVRKAHADSKGTPMDILTRMMGDLQRALKKPVAERRWAMAIDLKKCIGCKGCTVACRAENKTPPDVAYRPVFEEMEGNYPSLKRKFTPRTCMHCEKPACLEACPKEAIKRRPDGIVYVDYDKCEGVRACIPACPYEVPAFDEGAFFTEGTPAVQSYEKAPTFEMGIRRERNSEKSAPIGRMRKCHYCFHRLESGMLPACTTTCIGNATFFGDLNDSQSFVAELARSSRAHRLKESEGTKPTTFYLL